MTDNIDKFWIIRNLEYLGATRINKNEPSKNERTVGEWELSIYCDYLIYDDDFGVDDRYPNVEEEITVNFVTEECDIETASKKGKEILKKLKDD